MAKIVGKEKVKNYGQMCLVGIDSRNRFFSITNFLGQSNIRLQPSSEAI